MKIVLREEKKFDYYESEKMIQRAFYNVYMPGCDEHLLLHELRESKDYLPELSMVAEFNGKIIGGIYASIANLVTNGVTNKVLTFGPLGVDPDYQKLGIGKLLVNEFLKKSKATDYEAVVITGVPEYYPRFGFKSCYELNLTVEGGYQFPALMGLSLKDNFLEKNGGIFSETAVFERKRTLKEIDEYDKKFPYIPKEIRPTQWKKID